MSGKARLYFARGVVVYALLIFSFLAWLYTFRPTAGIDMFGISASGIPESIAFLRVGPGAMFLFMAVSALYGLLRPRYLRVALIFLVVSNACVVAERLFGIAVDGSSAKVLTELRNEGLSWLLFVAALWALRGYPPALPSSDNKAP
jgi:hypothetical protein